MSQKSVGSWGYSAPYLVGVADILETRSPHVMGHLFVCLFAWGLMALSAQIGYIAP